MQHPTSAAALAWCNLAALLLGCSASALAGPPGPPGAPAAATLADPTRPPAGLSAAAPVRGLATALPGSGPAGAAAGARGLAPAQALPANVLQSLQLPLHGPAVAMVDGQLVKAGDTLGKRTVLSIDSQGLVLRGEGGTERLWLLGGSAKQAPGSITTTLSSHFVAAPALDAVPPTPTEHNPSALPQPPAGATMPLVGRIKP